MASISLPTKQKIDVIEQDDMFTIRKSDWKRIKRLVNNVPKSINFVSIVYSILFGISGSALLTLIPLKNSSNLDTWVIPLYVIATVSTFILATILVIIEKKFLKREKESVKDINTEFEEIEKLCGSQK